MLQIVHDSRKLDHRNPGGALTCGAALLLRVHVSQANAVTLRLWRDGTETRVPMRELGYRNGLCAYEAEVEAPETACLWWYYFIVETDEGTAYYGNNPRGLGGIGAIYAQEPPSYQITVYERDFDTPHWMRHGVMYQIFVDRFYDGKNGEYLKRRKDIRVHGDWYELPDHIPDVKTHDNLANDFFGGNLPGITQKLDTLANLGVTALYLNPIFQANTNHKYDTGDYKKVDPTFGDEADFQMLCREAKKRGIRVILDGVFSHTGDDSVYFNRRGKYPSVGAYQSQDSPYYAWYKFGRFPDVYKCWWDFPTLPEVRKDHPDFVRFMIEDEDAVCAKWVRLGSSGWRLDVADELPDFFLEKMRARVKKENPEAAIIGEVWEDASNKVAYGNPRSYVFGRQLDSVMNYPLRIALVDFLTGRADARDVTEILGSLMENYPLPFLYSTYNLCGSHDRARILNVLAGNAGEDLPQTQRGAVRLSETETALGKKRVGLMIEAVCALPGMPGIYYGDEVGMQGAADPFCRGTYPWGREDLELREVFREAIGKRMASKVMQTGFCRVDAPGRDVLAVWRWTKDGKDAFGERIADQTGVCFVNRADGVRRVFLDPPEGVRVDTRGVEGLERVNGQLLVELPAMSAMTWVGPAKRENRMLMAGR